MSRVRVYLACSFDGYIAGEGDDLAWLAPPTDAPDPGRTEALEFEPFMAQVGCMLMGRRTHDVVAAMGEWPYGEMPVLVASTRALLEPAAATVRTVQGDIASLVRTAQEVAGDKDVYLDGGNLIRQAVAAGLVDEMVLTLVPVLLGGGVRLFDGDMPRTDWVVVAHHEYGHMLQVTLRPR